MDFEKTRPTQRDVFILRLWHPSAGEKPWRGQVQRVGSEEMVYFSDWEHLRNYLEQALEGAAKARPAKGKLV
ncbi:MAG: hypothetical protein JXA78_15425 [Anaerolineales bacterium]|nr:hypothetical protein [Anaerolineales bacterium]